MKKLLSVITILVLIFPLIALAATPKEFAEGLADKAIAVIKSEAGDSEKESKLIDIFTNNIDTDWMGRFAMGKYFRQATPEQQKRYLDLYENYVIYSYVPKFRNYSGEKLVVKQTIDEGDLVLVKTAIKSKTSSTGTILVDYKLKKSGDSYKIVDIIGEGVSLINTQRSDFTTPLSEQGIDYFLDRLEQKVQNVKAHPPKGVVPSAKKE